MGEPDDITSELVDQIATDASVRIADDNWLTASRSLSGVSLPAPDVLVPCDLRAVLFTAMVQQYLAPTSRVVVAAFSPREYCWRPSLFRRPWLRHLSRRIVRELPVQNLTFATEGMRHHTAECVGRDLSEANVQPIAIDTDRFRPDPARSVDRQKIVSVARLARYYAHHSQMIRVIAQLRAQGHSFTYHNYGDGEMRQALEAEARELGVDGAVFLHPSVPYDRFPDVIRDAFVAIGIGTSLLETAACGVPSLVGIDTERDPITYGFVQELEGSSVGGYVSGQTRYSIAERIVWLANRSEDEYRDLERAARARAEEFSLTAIAPTFVDILHGAVPFQISISKAEVIAGRLDLISFAALWKLGVRPERHVRDLAPV
jgi:1,2-diacylglycerol 3-alpha-glucosyltransferase